MASKNPVPGTSRTRARGVAFSRDNRPTIRSIYVPKIKQEPSDYPEDCVTEEQKQHYVDEYLQVENIELDWDNIAYIRACELSRNAC